MDSTYIKPIKKEKISDAVFKQLLQLIRSGRWEVGYKLPSENSLCELFNVSRVSVRTALHKLEAIGLLETRNGEGTFVRKTDMRSVFESVMETMIVTNKDIIDVLEIRRVIEQACIKKMVRNHTAEDIDELSRCLEQMRRLSETGDTIQYSVWDIRFHQYIVKCSENDVMIMIYELLHESIYAHLYTMNKEIGVNLGLSHHERLFSAILSGDEDTASECLAQSIDDSINQVKMMTKRTATEP